MMSSYSFSFPKTCRLLSASDFLYLKSGSRSYRTKTFICYYKKSPQQSSKLVVSRLGLAISKKVGKAHERNYFKRVTREFFRQSKMKYLGWDILVVFSPFIKKSFNNVQSLKKEIYHNLKFLENHLINSKHK